MNAARSARLATIARVQQLREQQQRVALAAATSRLQQQQQLLDQLQAYQQDYLDISAASDAARSVDTLRNASQFVATLSDSIAQQCSSCDQAQRQQQHLRMDWQRASAKLDAMESLVERARGAEFREQLRIEDLDAVEVWQASRARSRKTGS